MHRRDLVIGMPGVCPARQAGAAAEPATPHSAEQGRWLAACVALASAAGLAHMVVVAEVGDAIVDAMARGIGYACRHALPPKAEAQLMCSRAKEE